MSMVVSELFLTVMMAEEAGDLLMYHCRRGIGKEPLMLQFSLRKSPGEAVKGGLGRMAGPEGMTETGD